MVIVSRVNGLSGKKRRFYNGKEHYIWGGNENGRYTMQASNIYYDTLVEITEDSLVIKNCYLPGVSKQIPIGQIQYVQVFEPSLWTGKWRFWGTSTFQVWFAIDFKRAWRDAIFVVYANNSWLPIGFTVELSADFIRTLEERKIPVKY